MVIHAPELLRRVGIEAFLMAVRQFWPARGTRNEAAMALARVLLEAMAAHHPDDAERIAIVDNLVDRHGGGDGEDLVQRRAEATLEKMRAGEYATGMPRLLELLELPPNVAKPFRQWLGLSPGGVSLGVGQATFPTKRPTRRRKPSSIKSTCTMDGGPCIAIAAHFGDGPAPRIRARRAAEVIWALGVQFLDGALTFTDKGQLVLFQPTA